MKDKYYLVVNKHGEAYAGMLGGSLVWTDNWTAGKALHQENTLRVLTSNPGTELLEL